MEANGHPRKDSETCVVREHSGALSFARQAHRHAQSRQRDDERLPRVIFGVYTFHSVLDWACSTWCRKGLCAPNTHARPCCRTLSLPSISLRLVPHQHAGNLGPTLWDLSGGLIPFVGEGGREEWMIYWLLYKSWARLVISFQDAVMRFWSVFSPRWCDFVPDIISAAASAAAVSLHLCVVGPVCAPHALR